MCKKKKSEKRADVELRVNRSKLSFPLCKHSITVKRIPFYITILIVIIIALKVKCSNHLGSEAYASVGNTSQSNPDDSLINCNAVDPISLGKEPSTVLKSTKA